MACWPRTSDESAALIHLHVPCSGKNTRFTDFEIGFQQDVLALNHGKGSLPARDINDVEFGLSRPLGEHRPRSRGRLSRRT